MTRRTGAAARAFATVAGLSLVTAPSRALDRAGAQIRMDSADRPAVPPGAREAVLPATRASGRRRGRSWPRPRGPARLASPDGPRPRALGLVGWLAELVAVASPGCRRARASWVLPQDVASVPRARRLVRARLDGWGLRVELEVTELLVTELVANALRHADGEPVLTLTYTCGRLRCEVRDTGSGRPLAAADADPYDETGRGLHLVEVLSRRWGVEPANPGKSVWFEVPVHAGQDGLGCP
ncbi:ATP-binding protein [Sphaerisporangium sp. TRM90804]|uniref:ATP-binding protein n=1 Tax=Sphaerisporangium sp. TRM90804 TaxID=3031113 RepID=UPI00244C8C80|nr:ATP-binding protein [Sphaerisporangium sp. TRM90804]MDH2430238.1 ATP-binding protein [Sphaerisporangium sp. TRM90804]